MYNHLTVSLWGQQWNLNSIFVIKHQTYDLWGTFDTAAVKIQPGCPLPNMKHLQSRCNRNFPSWDSFPRQLSYALNSRETPQAGS